MEGARSKDNIRGEGRLHGTECSVSEGAAEPFYCVAGLVGMSRVEESVELCVKRLDLLLRNAAEELMPLGEFEVLCNMCSFGKAA